MPIVCLAKVSPLNPSTGNRVDLYISSAQNRAVTGLNGQVWEPAMAASPTLSINLWQGDFREPIDTGGASFSVNMGVLKMTYAGCDAYNWSGAPVEIYAEEPGTAWPWSTRFKGRVASYSRRSDVLTINASIETELFDKNILTATYAGTSGAEGGADLKGRLKPLVVGWAENVEPILIDTVNNVYQFSGYGAIEAVSVLYERAASFGASVGDYATYAALVAATIPAGRWGTCLAAGMVRLGAPAAGVITGDVRGHRVGGATPRLSGAVISALATIAGVSTANIETATLTSLDTAVPYPINLVLTEQVQWREMAAQLALACNWQSGITLPGKWFTLAVTLSGSEVITLNAQGAAMPQVIASDEADVSLPYYQTIFGANRCWRTQTSDEIAFTAELIDRGTYSGSETYREGNIVTTSDGARWLYINVTAGSGNAPPTLPTTSNAYWSNMTAASPVAVIGYLTNESHNVFADSSGAVSTWTGAGGTFVVQQNGVAQSSGVTFSLVSATGVTVSINATSGVYAASAMSANTGTATLRAVFNGVTVDKIFSISKTVQGQSGPPGTGLPATSGFLTNDAVSLFAYANGTVANYAPAAGSFVVFSGTTDVSSNFSLSTQSNPQALTVNYAGQTFAVTGGFDANEDNASLTIRATGSGPYAGVIIDRVFSLSKAKGGYEIVSTLPTTGNFEGRVVFLTTDDKLYRFDGANFTSAIPAADVSGQIISSQIASGAINTAKFAAGIEPVTVVSSVPGTKSTNTIYNSTDGETYRWNGTAYTKSISAGNISGSLTDAQLASISAAKITGTLSDAQLAAISAAKITGTLTDAQLTAISAAKITGTLTDAQLVSISAAKVSGTLSDAQLSAISAAKVTGQLVSAQISNGAITGSKLGVGVGSNQLIGAVPGTNPNRYFQMGWNPDNVTLGGAGDGGPILSPIFGTGFPGAVWTMPDQGTFAVQQPNATPNTSTVGVTNALDFYFKYPTGLDGSYSVMYPVEAGKTYEFSLYSGAHRCNVAIFVEWFDANQVSLNQTTPFVWNNYEQLGGTNLNTYKRLVSRGVAPSTARFGRLIVRKCLTLSGQTDSWLMATRAMFAETTANATEALPYNTPAFGLIHAEVMMANSLNANRIIAGSITSTQIAAGTITAANIAANTITAGQIAASTITGANIAGQTITAGNLVAGTITANEIAAATITGAKIAAGTITASNIVSGTITAGQIAAATITGSKIAAGTITAGNLVAGTITANEIAAATITGAKIAAGTITGSNLVAGTITAGEIAAGTITGSRLAAGTITANEIGANAVTAGKIAAGAVSADQIAANAIRAQHIAIAPSNLIPDPQFRDASLWFQDDESNSSPDSVLGSAVTGWYRSDDGNPATAIRGTSYLNLWAGRPSMNLNARYTVYGRIEVNNCFKPQPGVVYELKANAENYTNQWLVVMIQWVNYDNSAVISVLQTFIQPGQTGVFSVQGTPPAGAAYGRIVIHNQGAVSGGAALTGSALITNVVVREAAGATALIDGSVIANKVAAGAIEADKLAANSVVAGKVAADAITTNNIQAGAVTAAKVATSNLITLSAQINDGIITSAKIGDAQITNAKIGNLQVDTIKIANNAITITTSAYSTGSVTLTNGAWVDVQSIVFTATGAPILLLFNGQASQIASGIYNILRFRIVRDATVIYGPVENWSYQDENRSFSLSVTDTPSAGSFTYKVQAFLQTGSGGSCNVSYRSLIALETKR